MHSLSSARRFRRRTRHPRDCLMRHSGPRTTVQVPLRSQPLHCPRRSSSAQPLATCSTIPLLFRFLSLYVNYLSPPTLTPCTAGLRLLPPIASSPFLPRSITQSRIYYTQCPNGNGRNTPSLHNSDTLGRSHRPTSCNRPASVAHLACRVSTLRRARPSRPARAFNLTSCYGLHERITAVCAARRLRAPRPRARSCSSPTLSACAHAHTPLRLALSLRASKPTPARPPLQPRLANASRADGLCRRNAIAAVRPSPCPSSSSSRTARDSNSPALPCPCTYARAAFNGESHAIHLRSCPLTRPPAAAGRPRPDAASRFYSTGPGTHSRPARQHADDERQNTL